MRLVLTSTACLAVGYAVWIVGTPWHARNSEGIQRAVLMAALEVHGGPERAADSVVCAEVWTGRVWLEGPGEAMDPAPEVIAELRAISPNVVPQSECVESPPFLIHRPSGRDAVLIGVAAPTRIRDRFARVQGGYLLAQLDGVGFTYTVSFHRGRWVVDTERQLWIA